MKDLYLIGGAMGVGKTAVSQQLKRELPNSVLLDGDWCWDADPFRVTEETKAMVLENICFLLGNFLRCTACDHVIFCWVMHRQEIIDAILSRLKPEDCRVHCISLVCRPDVLEKRLLGLAQFNSILARKHPFVHREIRISIKSELPCGNSSDAPHFPVRRNWPDQRGVLRRGGETRCPQRPFLGGESLGPVLLTILILMVIVKKFGPDPRKRSAKGGGHLCIFEYIYFARPDSVLCGQSVHEARRRAGRFLAQEHPVASDVVIGVPDSGLDAAMGYAEESGIPYGMGLVKNRYIGRTFITPGQGRREEAVRIKLGALKSCVEGKRVVMVDDSIVRGTTSRQIVALLREAGAKEVHLRVSAPPFVAPCWFGTDIPDQNELIACKYSLEEIRAQTGADSLGFLSLAALGQIASGACCGFCDGCFTGKYPYEI